MIINNKQRNKQNSITPLVYEEVCSKSVRDASAAAAREGEDPETTQ